MLLRCNGAIETELDRRHGRREVRKEKRFGFGVLESLPFWFGKCEDTAVLGRQV